MAFQILSSDKVLRLNDFAVLGLVQSLDWSPAFNAQDVFELGNSAKVDTSLELETSGTLELMSSGGMPGLLARVITLRDGSGAFLGYKYDEELASFTATAGTTTTATSTVTTTANQYVGKYLKVLSGAGPVGEWRRIASHTTGANAVFTVSPAFGSAVTATSVCAVMGGRNGFSLTQDDFTEATFDLIVHEKADQKNLNRAVVLPRCFVGSISGRATADGNASESVAFIGDFAVGAPSPFHDVRAVPVTWTSSTTATLADATVDNTTHTLMYFYIDEQRLRTTVADGTYATLGASGVVTVTGRTIPANASMRAIVYKTTPSTTFPDVTAVERITDANYVRGYMADIFLAPSVLGSETDSEKWLRAQSIDWNANFRVDALRQTAFSAAGTPVYCRLPTLPFEISVNVSAYEDQWNDWAAMLDTTVKDLVTPSDVYEGTYDFSPASLKGSFAVNLKYYDKSKNLLQELRFTDLRLDGFGNRVNVGGRAEVTWNLRGTAFNMIGYNNS